MDEAAPAAMPPLVAQYLATLAGKAPSTIDAYGRALRQLTGWLADQPGSDGVFSPEQLTRPALELYLAHLEGARVSVSHRARVRSAVSGFARWLIEERGTLRRNPARGLPLPAQALLAPRQLDAGQRLVLRNLIDRDGSTRSAALFALGYWAGCRVSDVSWLRREDTHVGPRTGWLRVGHKGGKWREIDLVNDARRPLDDYLQHGGRDPASPYLFTSQRAERLTEAGIHHWFRRLKAQARQAEWTLIAEVTFHDLRHDFAHRARAAGWSLEEVAYYLGHITRKGLPAIQTTVRYTQVSRADLQAKLADLR